MSQFKNTQIEKVMKPIQKFIKREKSRGSTVNMNTTIVNFTANPPCYQELHTLLEKVLDIQFNSIIYFEDRLQPRKNKGMMATVVPKEVGKSISVAKNSDKHNRLNGIVCAHCNKEEYHDDAEYCYFCEHYLHS